MSNSAFMGISAKKAGLYLKHKRLTVPRSDRKKPGYSQAELCVIIGINSYQQLSQMEVGEVDWRRSKYTAELLEHLRFTETDLSQVGMTSSDLTVAQSISRLTPAQRATQLQVLDEARQESRPGEMRPVYNTGYGPSFMDEESEGEMLVEAEMLEKYPNLTLHRIVGSCLEPDYPNGWISYVVPDPALAVQGSPVLVWLSDNGRVVKHLISSKPDGDHVLFQPNPPEHESEIIHAPVGSVILGVVIDVRRGRAKNASLRAMYESLKRNAPELLEAEEEQDE